MPKSEKVQGAMAIVEDVLHALHLPGARTLGALIEKEIKERNKQTFEMLLEEMKKGRDEGVTFEENDAHDFVQMVLRLSDAAEKGTARRNLRLLAQVIVGLKRNQLFQFDNFQRWATVLETLTRDEILLLGTVYRLMKGKEHPWEALKHELVPQTFKTQGDLEAICASLMRTGLMIPASAFSGMAYNFNDATCDSSQYKIRIVALGANMNIFLDCPGDLHHRVGVANATIKTIYVSEIQTGV
jgi:hypothetical protein